MTAGVVVIGIGNTFRRDDGVGIAVADEIARRAPGNVGVVCGTGEPAAMLDAWGGARLAVVVDAATGADSQPGRIRRCGIDEVAVGAGLSSHAVSLRQTCELGGTLDRLPERLVVFTVAAADTGHGVGLTPAVAAAVPAVVAAVLAEVAAAIRQRSGSESLL